MSTLLVLGASSDIGRAVIEEAADRYDVIWAHYRTPRPELEELERRYGDRLRPVRADLSVCDEVAAMIETIIGKGPEPDAILHIPMSEYVINKFVKTDARHFRDTLDLAVESSVPVLKAFLPGMKKRRYGRVVFVLSSVTQGPVPPYQSAYVMGKYAMLGLMKSLAAEYDGSGICINGVSPDMIRTGYLSSISDHLIEQYEASRPSGRLLEVADVVPDILRLLSDDADCPNGTNIVIG